MTGGQKREGNDPGERAEVTNSEPPGPDCLLEEPPLGYALFRVMRATMFEDTPAPELDALPMAQLRLLWTVKHRGEATMKEFSERLKVSQSTVTQLADRLVKRDMIERVPDAADRRVVRLRLSDTGRRIMAEADQTRRQTLHEVWSALSETQQEEILHGLRLLGEAAEAVRARQGRPLPPFFELDSPAADAETTSLPSSQSQPVVDLMARRVRGG